MRTTKEGNTSINWKDEEAVIELTEILLEKDFGLKVELSKRHLCPTVTSRLNYVLFIHDLLFGQENRVQVRTKKEDHVRGIDVLTFPPFIFLV